MISFEIRINGSLIGAMQAVNRRFTGKTHPTRGPECEYEWSSAQFPWDLKDPAETHTGTLKHYRGDGAVALVHALCRAHITATRKKKLASSSSGSPELGRAPL